MSLLEQYTKRIQEYNAARTKYEQSSAAAKEALKIEDADRVRASDIWVKLAEARLAYEESIK